MVFVSYSIAREAMRSNSRSFIVLPINVSCFIHFFFFVVCVTHFGSSLAKETRKTITMFSKTMNSLAVDGDSQKVDLIYVLSQLKSRNVIIQNDVFPIDWKAFVSVSVIDVDNQLVLYSIECLTF